jgi:hypothetical protein
MDLRTRSWPLLTTLLVASCNVREAPLEPLAVREPPAARAATPTASGVVPFPPDAPPSCATLRDVGVSDIVRVEGTTLFYADATAGLTVVDVADPAQPRQLAVVPFTGIPLGLFVREGIAWLVFIDTDGRGPAPIRTVVRAVDVRRPAAPRVIGEEVREGSSHDVTLVGGFLYVLRRSGTGRSVVESFGVQGTTLAPRGLVTLEGAPAQLASSPAGLAVVTTSDDHADVAWLDLSLETAGSLVLRRSVRLPGGIASWERGEGKLVDADEGQRVRLVMCATASCSPTGPSILRIVDFTNAERAQRPTSLRLTEHDGLPTTRFRDGVLYVAETSASGSETSMLHVIDTEAAAPRFVAHHPLRGKIAALVPHESSLVALGSIGSPETQVRLIVHDVDVRRPFAPRTRGSVSFGSDWTWSVIMDDDRAMSFDPASHLVAVPFTAWRHADSRYATGTQLVDLQPIAGRTGPTLHEGGWVERAVFLDGHLLTLGPSGITSIDYASSRTPDHGETSIDTGRR